MREEEKRALGPDGRWRTASLCNERRGHVRETVARCATTQGLKASWLLYNFHGIGIRKARRLSSISAFSWDHIVGTSTFSKHPTQVFRQHFRRFMRSKVSPTLMFEFGNHPLVSPNPATKYQSKIVRERTAETYAFGNT